MSERDWLKEAAGALRDEAGGDAPAGVDTRARVMASLQRQQAARRRWVSFAVPLAAVFLFSSAWAASTGRLLPALARLAGATVDEPVAVPTARPAPLAAKAAGLAASATAEPEAPPVAPTATATAEPEAPGAPPAAAGSDPAPAVAAATASAKDAAPASPASASASAKGEASEEDRLYREAHQAHFAERNPEKALRAWDAYLRAQKSGRFVTEAAYNRALTLVRLGRAAEARRALEPFAQGRFGSYRQAEAQKLLEAL